MSVFFTDGHAMVAIPGIKHGFLHVAGRSSCLEEWGLGVMGFPCGMRWHHVTGSPIGTGSSMPNATSRSISAFTHSCQWMGTGTGVW